MEQIKRKRETTNSINKKQKLESKSDILDIIHSNSSSRITRFEDLPNEILYEIFDMLDFCSAYGIFANLNIRFHQILMFSTTSIKINNSFISKSIFQRYYKQIILPNKHRINSLHLSNPFIVDIFFPSPRIISEFPRLETLILNNIKSKGLINLLKQLTKLPNFSSLTIIHCNRLGNIDNLYHQIFRLPTLKYCKLLFPENSSYSSLPISTNEISSIEHLVIKNKYSLNELDVLLSYVPKLRYLNLNHLYKLPNEETKPFLSLLNHLTHISINNSRISFNQLELLAKNLFHQLEVFHISTYNDISYLDANHWEQLILSYMPNLRVFDFMHINSLDQINRLKYEELMRKFQSSFWSERQWFFMSKFYWKYSERYVIFHSTHPYRRKSYILYTKLNKQIDLNQQENNLNSVQHICIQGEQGMIDCNNRFPNTTTLTLSCNLIQSENSLSTYFNRIFIPERLNKLVITLTHIPFMLVIKLLSLLPNIHTLVITCAPMCITVSSSIQEHGLFQLVSQNNTINNLIIKEKDTIENTQLLIALCPRIQYLTIDISREYSELIIGFLLSKANKKMKHLFSLHAKNITRAMVKRLKTMIHSKKLLGDYSIQQIDSELYLWW